MTGYKKLIVVWYNCKRWGSDIFLEITDTLPKRSIKEVVNTPSEMHVLLKNDCVIKMVRSVNQLHGSLADIIFIQDGTDKQYIDYIIRHFVAPDGVAEGFTSVKDVCDRAKGE